MIMLLVNEFHFIISTINYKQINIPIYGYIGIKVYILYVIILRYDGIKTILNLYDYNSCFHVIIYYNLMPRTMHVGQ